MPQDQPYWEKLAKAFKNLAVDYGFQRIDTPIIEETDLFTHGVGMATDIVEKQMYSFKTKGDDNLTLRPEGTAGVVRAFIENGLINLPQPVKLCYTGPMFRYEQPQTGRFRQFYQIGAEVFGSEEAILDAQIILFFYHLLQEVGIKKTNIQINSIGCLTCRATYRKVLIDYYRRTNKKICPDCQRRLKTNPLRMLDCKNEKCQELAKDAPGMVDYLCETCRDHFTETLEYLDELELPYFLNRSLVRGLDYYTKTVFEIWPDVDKEDGKVAKAKSALGGGGRYDSLMAILGGKDMPAVGVAFGVERIVALMKEKEVKLPSTTTDIFLIQLGTLAKKKSLKLFDQLLKEGVTIAESFSRDSIKAQLKIADRLEAKFSLILGQQEALDETIIIRDMSSGVQETVPLDKIIPLVKKKLKD